VGVEVADSLLCGFTAGAHHDDHAFGVRRSPRRTTRSRTSFFTFFM
jgi:hypothetical protein